MSGLPGGIPSPPGSGGSGGSSSSGGSSGGSSGSSGGSSGPSKGEQQYIANAIATYQQMVLQLGIPLTKQLQNMIARMAQQHANSAQFMRALRKTKDYAAEFPGIMRKDGTLRMTEAQYIAGYQAAKDYAASLGRGFSKAAFGLAMKNGNSPNEIKAKLGALDMLKQNKGLMDEFSQYLMSQHLIKNPLNREQMLKYIMREGPKEFEDAWNTAQQTAAFARLGIEVGKPKMGGDISYKELKKLQNQMLPGDKVDYQKTSDILNSLPASQLYGMGLTKKDAARVAFGGKGADNIVKQAQKAIGTYAARFQDEAQRQLTPRGLLGGPPEQQATE